MPARQLTHRFHLLRLSETTLVRPQCLFDVLAVAQVVDDAGEVALTFG